MEFFAHRYHSSQWNFNMHFVAAWDEAARKSILTALGDKRLKDFEKTEAFANDSAKPGAHANTVATKRALTLGLEASPLLHSTHRPPTRRADGSLRMSSGVAMSQTVLLK